MLTHQERLLLYCAKPFGGSQFPNLQAEKSRVPLPGYGPQFEQDHPLLANAPLHFRFGDVNEVVNIPTIVKSRCIGDTNAILYPLIVVGTLALSTT